MDATRRGVLAASSGALALLSGCAGMTGILGGSESFVPVETLRVDLHNASGEPHVFHFALEGEEGLGEWYDHDVAPGSTETVSVSLDEALDGDPAASPDRVGIHAIVDGHRTGGHLHDHYRDDPTPEGDTVACREVRITYPYDSGDDPLVISERYGGQDRCQPGGE